MSKVVLQINEALAVTSTGHIVEELGRAAEQAGWVCYAAHGARYHKPSALHHITLGTRWSEYLHGLLSLIANAHGLGSRIATQKLIKTIEAVRPDIIHLHNLHGYYLNYPMLMQYLAQAQIPVVWTLHDCWTMTGHCAHFASCDCTQWETECHDCPLYADYPRAFGAWHTRRNFSLKKELFTAIPNTHIVCVSNWLSSIAKKSLLSPLPIQTIYNGVDTQLFRPCDTTSLRESVHAQGKKVLLGVASIWNEHKGLYDYIRIAKRLDAQQYLLILIGIDNKKHLFPDNVLCVARTETREELAEYYSMADALLCLSHQETFGLTLAEAMAAGTPCVAYDRTAMSEIVTQETGALVPMGDDDQLLQAIENVCTKGKEHYATACRQRSCTLFDKANTYQQYIELYNTIIA